MRQALAIAVGVLLALSPIDSGGAGSPDESSELDGTWVEVVYRPSREEHPALLPPPSDPMTLEIDGHLFLEKSGDRVFRQSLLKLVPGKMPRAADLTTVVEGEFWLTRAIYKVEGDALTVCEGARDGARPTTFRRSKGVDDEMTLLTTYKRQPSASIPDGGARIQP